MSVPVMRAVDLGHWDEAISRLPGRHLLQAGLWAGFKSRYGWKAYPLTWVNAGEECVAAAMLLQRRIGPGLSMLYIPRGPILDWSDRVVRQAVIADLEKYCRQSRAIYLKFDPELILGYGEPGEEGGQVNAVSGDVEAEWLMRGWRRSENQVQFRNTVWLDLSGDEQAWLDSMKQKTRYNLRLAERKGVVVRRGSEKDFHTLYRMYAETSVRDGFVIRDETYYTRLWTDFMAHDQAMPLIAEVGGEPIAGLFLFWYGQRAWYLYGMSTAEHREKMPNYLLQWEAMRLAKEKGALIYDLWGAPDHFDETDSMWGVYKFKRGLGGRVIRTTGAWDFIHRRVAYQLTAKIMPRILEWMRQRRNIKTQQEVST